MNIRLAARRMARDPLAAALSVAGLALGLAAVLLTLLYVRAEYTYDTAGLHSDRTYRIQSDLASTPGPDWAFVPMNLANTIAGRIPGIEAMGRYLDMPEMLVTVDGVSQYEGGIVQLEPEMFDMMGLSLSLGAIRQDGVVLTAGVAQTYFGADNPIGERMLFDGQHELEVVGVMATLPNTHAAFDIYVVEDGSDAAEWPSWGWTYVQLAPGVDPVVVGEEATRLYREAYPDFGTGDGIWTLFPLEDIHLESHILWEIAPNGNEAYVQLVLAVSVLVLLISLFNFMNLGLVRHLARFREVGVQKALGADGREIRKGIRVDALMLVGSAVALATVLTWSLSGPMRAFTGLHALPMPSWFVIAPGLVLAVVLMACAVAAYPAFMLSRLHPVVALRDSRFTGGQSARVRRALVVGQFAISIFLISGTAFIGRQMAFVQSVDLGFTSDPMVVFPVRDQELRKNYEGLRDRLLAHPAISHVTTATNFPGSYELMPNQGVFRPEIADFEPIQMPEFVADEHFLDAMGLELVAGRNFDPLRATDADSAFIFTESAVAALGLEGDPIGAVVRTGMQDGVIVGIIKDFHLKSLHEAQGPVGIEYHSRSQLWWMREVGVRIDGDVPAALAHMEQVWNELDPTRPFNYSFMDDDFNRQYLNEQTLIDVFRLLAGLTVFIACMGLFGIAADTALRRRRELGIRKSLGASTGSLVSLLTWDFLRLVLIGLVLSVPLTVYAVGAWLDTFAYSSGLSLWPLLGGGILAAGVAASTVLYHTLRAARMNPVDALRG